MDSHQLFLSDFFPGIALHRAVKNSHPAPHTQGLHYRTAAPRRTLTKPNIDTDNEQPQQQSPRITTARWQTLLPKYRYLHSQLRSSILNFGAGSRTVSIFGFLPVSQLFAPVGSRCAQSSREITSSKRLHLPTSRNVGRLSQRS